MVFEKVEAVGPFDLDALILGDKQEPGIKTVQSSANVLGLPVSELFESLEGLEISAERAQMEFQLRDLARGLTDRDLAVAIAHIQALLTTK
ncbi:hypothetical protein [Bradyrhizobium sp. ARR65]|uniref:hypothetical protein n=1 Tax=Bradyrhizobium sp. ARR65 TaxID=1040989 RepID=UPI000A005F31|nr:hypothetical protein [Bradyrhizobium sp. ARR65]